MQFFSLVSTVINETEAFTSGTQPEAFTDTVENTSVLASDFVDKFLNMDFIKEHDEKLL